MDELEYWRWCDELNIFQAALLSVGVDPASESGSYCENWEIHERPHGYEAAKTALSNALRQGAIKGRIVPLYRQDINGNECDEYPGSVDLAASTLDVESLRAWLNKRGLKPAFFFPASTDAPDYLDPRNPRYAPKLAAAVQAWQAVTDANGKPPKQALVKWLREHAADFGLSDEEGKPNETGIDETAKVANWQPGGGAPKTPGQ